MFDAFQLTVSDRSENIIPSLTYATSKRFPTIPHPERILKYVLEFEDFQTLFKGKVENPQATTGKMLQDINNQLRPKMATCDVQNTRGSSVKL